MARMRGAITTVPGCSREVKINRSDDASDGFVHAHDVRAPETMAKEIANRSAEMETPFRFGKMVHNSERKAETREWYGSATSTRLLHEIAEVVSGAEVMTTTDTVEDPIENE